MAVADRPVSKRFYVSGVVQGVGFRYFAQRVARQLGTSGYAKNLSDGRVEIYAIGSPEALFKLRRELERGPRAASVSDVVEEDADFDGRYADVFTIEHDTW